MAYWSTWEIAKWRSMVCPAAYHRTLSVAVCLRVCATLDWSGAVWGGGGLEVANWTTLSSKTKQKWLSQIIRFILSLPFPANVHPHSQTQSRFYCLCGERALTKCFYKPNHSTWMPHPYIILILTSKQVQTLQQMVDPQTWQALGFYRYNGLVWAGVAGDTFLISFHFTP